jgi:hypothetical protein
MPSLATFRSLATWHLIILSLVTGTTFFHRYLVNGSFSNRSFIGGTLQYKVSQIFPLLLTKASSETAIRKSTIKDFPNIFHDTNCSGAALVLYESGRIARVSMGNARRRIPREFSCSRTVGHKVTALHLTLPDFESNGRLMGQRHRLEKQSGTKAIDSNVSPEMKAMNRKFGIAHGIVPPHLLRVNGNRSLEFAESELLHCSGGSNLLHCRLSSIEP